MKPSELAFGWKNCHLHDFYSGGIRFGSGNDEEPELLVDERAAPLGAVAQVGAELLYHYDFGDDWEHRIVVENVIANGSEAVVCAGACEHEALGWSSFQSRAVRPRGGEQPAGDSFTAVWSRPAIGGGDVRAKRLVV